MVQQNLLCPTCRDDSTFDQSNRSWKDLQGLSWLFCEDCIQEDSKSVLVLESPLSWSQVRSSNE